VGSTFITAAEALAGCRGLTSRLGILFARHAILSHPISAPGMLSEPRADEECFNGRAGRGRCAWILVQIWRCEQLLAFNLHVTFDMKSATENFT